MQRALSLPHATLTRAYLQRGIGLWVASRLVVSLVMALAEVDPWRPTPLASLQIVFFTAAIAWVDMHRRKERALLGNLGVSRVLVAAICSLPAAAGETGIALIVLAV